MIRPSEFYKTFTNTVQFDHVYFMGKDKIPAVAYEKRIDKRCTCIYDFTNIDYEKCTNEYGYVDYGKALLQVFNYVKPHITAYTLDKFFKVREFIVDEEKRTIYIYCKLR